MKSAKDKNYFTTGEIATMLHVTPRTVSKWFDRGVLQGWQYPISGDRRIDKKSLLSFMRKNNIRCELLTSNLRVAILLYSLHPEFHFNLHELSSEEFVITRATSLLHVGKVLASEVIHIAVLDCMMGRSDCLTIAKHIHSETHNVLVAAIVNDDENYCVDFTKENGFDLVVKRPFPQDTFTSFIMENKDGLTEVPKVKGKSRSTQERVRQGSRSLGANEEASQEGLQLRVHKASREASS